MSLNTNPETKQRMLILIPDGVTNIPDLAQKILWMLMAENHEVLFLAIANDKERTLSVSRSLTTLKAAINVDWFVSATKIVTADEWYLTLKKIYRPGDTIICHEEQVVTNGFLSAIPASDFLRETLNAPVRTISGFYHPHEIQARELLRNGLFWIGFLGILTIFTGLEIKMEQSVQGITRNMILILLVFLEVGSFWVLSQIKN